MELDLQNPLIYSKIKKYDDFFKTCHVGDTYVWGPMRGRTWGPSRGAVKSVITKIKKSMVFSTIVYQTNLTDIQATKNMGVNIHYAFNYGVPLYKYIGPTSENIQKKQNVIEHLTDFLVEARLRPFEEGGSITFIGEDYRAGRDTFNQLFIC